MRQLDAHRAGTGRLFDGQLVRIFWSIIVEAAITVDPWQLADCVHAVKEFWGLGVDGWFGDAFISQVCGEVGQIVGRDHCGESVGPKADEGDHQDLE